MCKRLEDSETEFFRGIILSVGKRYMKSQFIHICIDNRVFICDNDSGNVAMIHGADITLGSNNTSFVTKEWISNVQKISNFSVTIANSMIDSINNNF